METTLDPEILEQIRAILRRDLKLAADEPLPAEMPFFGGSVDLDSLDMLLLLTSIERQYGVKIASQELGKQVFQNVASLARFVQENRTQTEAVDWLKRLPHGPEFRFLTRVVQVLPGQSARGEWALNGKESFFAGHFPGTPIVPGVLIVEALAQLCGLAGPSTNSAQGKLAHIDVRFEQSVAPPVTMQLSAKVVRVLGALQMFDVTAQAGEKIVAQGSITLHRAEMK